MVKIPDNVCFELNNKVKTIDNEVGMKPPGQILVERFYFYPVIHRLKFFKPILE
jgi:hypothetical protein